MGNDNSAGAPPPGVEEQADIQIDPGTFPLLERLLERHPDICQVPAATRKSDACVINHPDLIKRVLIDNHRNYVKGPGFERAKLLLGNGIIVSDGETWKRQRRMVQPSFHRDMLRDLSRVLQKESLKLKRELETAADAGRAIDLGETMSRFALAVILRSLFGDDLDRLIDEAGVNPFSMFTDSTSRDMKLAVRFRALRSSIIDLIRRRRDTAGGHGDIVSALIAARDLQGGPMDEQYMVDEIMTLIVAGHETSAITLTWLWYLTASHPETEARLQAEVDALGLEPGGAPDYEQAVQLTYCKQAMSEALRLYPPVWLFSRKSLEADRLGDYAIPGGTDIFISPYFLHRRKDLWPEPERFDPERFSEAACEGRHRVAFIPFSAGPRKCIGDVFAALEIQTHIGTIAGSLRLRPEHPAPAGTPALEPAINLRTRQPIRVYPEYRRQ